MTWTLEPKRKLQLVRVADLVGIWTKALTAWQTVSIQGSVLFWCCCTEALKQEPLDILSLTLRKDAHSSGIGLTVVGFLYCYDIKLYHQAAAICSGWGDIVVCAVRQLIASRQGQQSSAWACTPGRTCSYIIGLHLWCSRVAGDSASRSSIPSISVLSRATQRLLTLHCCGRTMDCVGTVRTGLTIDIYPSFQDKTCIFVSISTDCDIWPGLLPGHFFSSFFFVWRQLWRSSGVGSCSLGVEAIFAFLSTGCVVHGALTLWPLLFLMCTVEQQSSAPSVFLKCQKQCNFYVLLAVDRFLFRNYSFLLLAFWLLTNTNDFPTFVLKK